MTTSVHHIHTTWSAVTGSPGGSTSRLPCLTVAADPALYAWWARRRQPAGWSVDLATTAFAAAVAYQRKRYRLVFVESSSFVPGSIDPLREFVAAIRSSWLGVVIGPPQCSEAEIWARQMGAWLYLPGIDDTTDLSVVFAEAARIARTANVY